LKYNGTFSAQINFSWLSINGSAITVHLNSNSVPVLDILVICVLFLEANEQQKRVSLSSVISHVVTATVVWGAQVATLSGLKFVKHLHMAKLPNVGIK